MDSRRERGRPPYADVLTPAEWRVVEAVRHGMSNPQIAKRQGVSVDAIKFHVANALQKLGFSSRADLRRWDGVRQDSLLRERMGNVETGFQLGQIGQVSRSVSDVVAARRWYGEVLGLRHLYSFGDLAFFDCCGVRLFLSQGEALPESIIYLTVGDIHEASAALAARGVEFRNAPHLIHRHEDRTEEWMTFFDDPDGRPLALMSRLSVKAEERQP
jgi:DNA-binding CsgD family transcriptional regulator/catechol 2,3-dioxygenase-like lactoylglutathione lyase family enzyme